MVISLVILLVLVWSFYIGYSRGLALQLFYSLSSLVALFVANLYYVKLAKLLSLWVPYSSANQDAVNHFFSQKQVFDLDKVFYAGLAFFLIFTATYWVCRLLGVLVHVFPLDAFKQAWSKPLAGLLAVWVAVLVLQMGLTLLSTLSIPQVQAHLQSNPLIALIIHFPLSRQLLENLWIHKIIG